MPSIWDIPTLVGRFASIVPLSVLHVPGLARAAADGELWTLAFTNVPAPGAEHVLVAEALQAQALGQSMAFAVLDATNSVIGTTRYYDIDRGAPSVRIGYTWYAKSAQRTAVNTECKLMLLRHAFDVLHCESVGFETSHLNTCSQAAIERLGAHRDGILRANRRHRDGTLRDTWCYSIVREEWPSVQHRLDSRLLGDAVATPGMRQA